MEKDNYSKRLIDNLKEIFGRKTKMDTFLNIAVKIFKNNIILEDIDETLAKIKDTELYIFDDDVFVNNKIIKSNKKEIKKAIDKFEPWENSYITDNEINFLITICHEGDIHFMIR